MPGGYVGWTPETTPQPRRQRWWKPALPSTTPQTREKLRGIAGPKQTQLERAALTLQPENSRSEQSEARSAEQQAKKLQPSAAAEKAAYGKVASGGIHELRSCSPNMRSCSTHEPPFSAGESLVTVAATQSSVKGRRRARRAGISVCSLLSPTRRQQTAGGRRSECLPEAQSRIIPSYRHHELPSLPRRQLPARG